MTRTTLIDGAEDEGRPAAAPAAAPEPAARLARLAGLRASVTKRRAMVVMAALSVVANAVNYASSLVFSRLLEPVGFGELTSLLALTVMLAVPLAAAQTVIADRIAVARARNDFDRVRYLIRYALGHVAVLSVVSGAIYLACVPLIVEVFDIRQPGPVLAVAPLLVLTFVTPVIMGALQGLERWVAFGAALVAIAFSRLAFGIPWAAAGGGAGGAIGGQAVGLLLVLIAFGWYYRDLLIGRGTGAATRGIRRRLDAISLSASGAFIALAVLSNLDVVLARLFLDNHDAGVYAAIATVAKIALFLPSAVAWVLVPRAAASRIATGSGQAVLRKSAAVALALGLACLIPAVLAPGVVVDVMFGGGYEDAVDGVLPAVVAGVALATLTVVCNYAVATADRRWTFLLVGGIGLQVAAISLFHGSPVEIAWAQAGAALLTLMANEAATLPLLKRREAM